MTKTITYCDACKKEIEDQNHVTKIQFIPPNHARQISETYDVCDTCATRIRRTVQGVGFKDPFM